MGFRGLILRSITSDFRPVRAWGDERTEGRKDERKSPCVLQDFVPFGAAAQKVDIFTKAIEAIPFALL